MMTLSKEFTDFEETSTTGASDAHQSIAQSLSYSAKAKAMEEAIARLVGEQCPGRYLKIYRVKKTRAEEKAKKTGEAHHLK